MKTFIQYLEEKWKLGREFGGYARNTKIYPMPDESGKITNPNITSSLKTTFKHLDRGKYIADFSVNRKHDSEEASYALTPEHRLHALDHVKKSIHTFVRHVKPKSIELEPNHPSKEKLYHSMAHRLATKHGGHVEDYIVNGDGGPGYRVHFPQNITT